MTEPTAPHDRDDDPARPSWRETHLWSIAAVRDVFWTAFGIALLWLAFSIRDVLTPFLLAFAIAYVIKPVVDMTYEKWSVPRAATAAGIVLAALALLVGLTAYFAPLIYEQAKDVATRVPEFVSTELSKYGIDVDERWRQLKSSAKNGTGSATDAVTPLVEGTARAFGYLGRIVGATTYLLTAAAVIPIYTFYFAWRYDAFLDHLKDLVPAGQRNHVLELVAKFDDTFGKFVRGRILIGLIQVVLFCIVFWLADIPFWFLLGVITGLLCIVPIIGFIGWPLAILAKAVDGGGWMEVLVWPTVAYAVVQSIEMWVLTPLIQGRSLNISPFMVLFAIVVGGSIGGLFGALLSLPLANCIAIVYHDVVKPRLDDWSRAGT